MCTHTHEIHNEYIKSKMLVDLTHCSNRANNEIDNKILWALICEWEIWLGEQRARFWFYLYSSSSSSLFWVRFIQCVCWIFRCVLWLSVLLFQENINDEYICWMRMTVNLCVADIFLFCPRLLLFRPHSLFPSSFDEFVCDMMGIDNNDMSLAAMNVIWENDYDYLMGIRQNRNTHR